MTLDQPDLKPDTGQTPQQTTVIALPRSLVALIAGVLVGGLIILFLGSLWGIQSIFTLNSLVDGRRYSITNLLFTSNGFFLESEIMSLILSKIMLAMGCCLPPTAFALSLVFGLRGRRKK